MEQSWWWLLLGRGTTQNMALENGAFEDVFPIVNVDIPFLC